MSAVLSRGLLWIKPPAGARECLVLDHRVREGELSAAGGLFERARNHGDPDALRLLAEALGGAIGACAPEWSLLRQATQVVAVPSSDGVTRALATAVAGALGCQELDWPELDADVSGADLHGVVVLVDGAIRSTATFEAAARCALDAGAAHVLCVAAIVVDHVWE